MIYAQFCICAQAQTWKVGVSVAQLEHYYRWSIAGNITGGSPNILSEVIWDNLSGPKLNLSLSRSFNKSLELYVNYSKHYISRGTVKDTDYLEDNRVNSFFAESLLANKGDASTYTVLVKHKFFIAYDLYFEPYVGLALLDNELYLLDFPSTQRNPALNSSYKNWWKGTLFGTEASWQTGKLGLNLNVGAGYYNYIAKARWNLNEKFDQPLSFKHIATAYSFLTAMKISYFLSKHVEILIGLEKTYGITNTGIDEAYLSNGTSTRTKFNGAEFESLETKIGFKLAF